MSDNDVYDDDPRQACNYGANCYQRNPQHRKRYKHPPKDAPEPKPDKRKIGDETDNPKKSKLDSKKPDDEKPEPEITKRDDSSSDSSDSESESDLPASPKDVKDNISQKFLVSMPDDFYSFWDFCESVNQEKPEDAFVKFGLKLVGPFDVLSGKLRELSDRKPSSYLRHWRYYYDPPEVQTVIKGDDETQFHFGYFRDDPKEMPIFVVENSAAKNCILKPVGENLFAAVSGYMKDRLKTVSIFDKVPTEKLLNNLEKWAKDNDFSLEKNTPKISEREKKVVTKSFHRAGIVVPFDKKTELGYRPLHETDSNLKKMLAKITEADEKDRDAKFEDIQNMITCVQFANDECDFGMGLELGMDLFCFGDPCLDGRAGHLLATAYTLLGREPFAKIITAHLKGRKKSADLSAI